MYVIVTTIIVNFEFIALIPPRSSIASSPHWSQEHISFVKFEGIVLPLGLSLRLLVTSVVLVPSNVAPRTCLGQNPTLPHYQHAPPAFTTKFAGFRGLMEDETKRSCNLCLGRTVGLLFSTNPLTACSCMRANVPSTSHPLPSSISADKNSMEDNFEVILESALKIAE